MEISGRKSLLLHLIADSVPAEAAAADAAGESVSFKKSVQMRPDFFPKKTQERQKAAMKAIMFQGRRPVQMMTRSGGRSWRAGMSEAERGWTTRKSTINLTTSAARLMSHAERCDWEDDVPPRNRMNHRQEER
jgi:hypothetical protein